MKEQSLKQRLWSAADKLRANSKLKPSDYAEPVLGLIFLRFADFKFQSVLISLLKNFSEIPMDKEGDHFGKIYEYFLGKFA